MGEIYESYKDIAAFRILYISEAHAVDDRRPTEFAQLKGIFEAKTFGERCTTAEMMMKDENISIPCIIDDIDNGVGDAYDALPDRIYIVGVDGRVVVKSGRGPRGFAPGLRETERWLAGYRESLLE